MVATADGQRVRRAERRAGLRPGAGRGAHGGPRRSRRAQAAALTEHQARRTAPLRRLLAQRRVLVLVAGGFGDQRRREALLDGLLGDYALLHVATRGQLEL